MRPRSIFLLLFLIVILRVHAQPGPLAEGRWYKIGVKERGVFSLTRDDLKKMGFDVQQINPKHIRIFGQRGGMLPQPNGEPRPEGLTEVAIHVTGEGDGRFDKNDVVLFYAEGPDEIHFDEQKEVFQYTSNFFSDYNYYFVSVGSSDGKRIQTKEKITGSFPEVNHYPDFFYHESDEFNILMSGREWWGDRIFPNQPVTLKAEIPGILSGSKIKLVSSLMGQCVDDSKFELRFNGTQIGDFPVLPIPDSRYGVKGRERNDTLELNEQDVGAHAANEQEWAITYLPDVNFGSTGYVNYLLMNFQRALKRYENQSIVTAPPRVQETSTYVIADSDPSLTVWDVTDPLQPKVCPTEFQNTTSSFSDHSLSLKKYILFNDKYRSPERVGPVSNQDIRNIQAGLLIVTNKIFVAEAQRLASHRGNASVVTTEQVFNEFSGGRQDVTAIRDFIKFIYDKNPGALQAVLLFGKCSYDYKERISDNTNFVPTYQSRNSLSPLESYASDDYFGFLEDHEGNWKETFPIDNHTLDLAIGRLPASSEEEARIVVDKLIDYDDAKQQAGAWRKKLTFVADDGNTDDDYDDIHQQQANFLSQFIEQENPSPEMNKLFLGTYDKVKKDNVQTVPELTKDIVDAFEEGSLVINYSGHGAERIWADERILTDDVIRGLSNQRYPFLITATCEFGRHDNPQLQSGAELTLIQKEAGTVGVLTSTRDVNAVTNFVLNNAFYQALFEKQDNQFPTLGAAFMFAKNNSMSGVANRNFSLLGDPSMHLAIPSLNVVADEIKTTTGSDTLKALSTVRILGRVLTNDSTTLSSFNGEAEVILTDSPQQISTTGLNNPPFVYSQWSNYLFRGKVAVRQGEFSIQFLLPKTISPNVDQGKLFLYAADPSQGLDAMGGRKDIRIGGTEPAPPLDNTPPQLSLYLGDSTYIEGGEVGSDTRIVVRVTDEHGVNLSSLDPVYAFVAILDDTLVYPLSSYYISDVNTTSGWVSMPLRGLSEGKHSITVRVWDLHLNGASASLDFNVGKDEFKINSFYNAPNPVMGSTSFYFSHNRPGEDLEFSLKILTLSGSEVFSSEGVLLSSPYVTKILDFQNEKKLAPGIYLAKVLVRSLSDGAKNERGTKLIVLY